MEEEGKSKDYETILKASNGCGKSPKSSLNMQKMGTITASIIFRESKVSFQRACVRGSEAGEKLGELEGGYHKSGHWPIK